MERYSENHHFQKADFNHVWATLLRVNKWDDTKVNGGGGADVASYRPSSSCGTSDCNTSDTDNDEWSRVVPLSVDDMVSCAEKVFFDLYTSAKYTDLFFKNRQKLVVQQSTKAVTVTAPKYKNPQLYKTKLCNYWNDKSHCKFGAKCLYAHGLHELRYVMSEDEYP